MFPVARLQYSVRYFPASSRPHCNFLTNAPHSHRTVANGMRPAVALKMLPETQRQDEWMGDDFPRETNESMIHFWIIVVARPGFGDVHCQTSSVHKTRPHSVWQLMVNGGVVVDKCFVDVSHLQHEGNHSGSPVFLLTCPAASCSRSWPEGAAEFC